MGVRTCQTRARGRNAHTSDLLQVWMRPTCFLAPCELATKLAWEIITATGTAAATAAATATACFISGLRSVDAMYFILRFHVWCICQKLKCCMIMSPPAVVRRSNDSYMLRDGMQRMRAGHADCLQIISILLIQLFYDENIFF